MKHAKVYAVKLKCLPDETAVIWVLPLVGILIGEFADCLPFILYAAPSKSIEESRIIIAVRLRIYVIE